MPGTPEKLAAVRQRRWGASVRRKVAYLALCDKRPAAREDAAGLRDTCASLLANSD